MPLAHLLPGARIYVSGLGAPTSTATDASVTTAPKFPGSCISLASYFGAVNALSTPPGTPWTSDEGAVILASNLGTNKYPPCFATSPTVTIGGAAATVTYAGWVANSVAGLYQINGAVPSGGSLPKACRYWSRRRGNQPGRCNNGCPAARLPYVIRRKAKTWIGLAAGRCTLAPAAVFLCSIQPALLRAHHCKLAPFNPCP